MYSICNETLVQRVRPQKDEMTIRMNIETITNNMNERVKGYGNI